MSGPMNNDPRTSTEIERDILRAGLRERDEEIARLRAVVAGDPSPRMIRTEDVARVLWPFVYAGRRDACHDEGFGPRFDDLAQTAQDLFCALIDEAMQTMGAAIKRDPAEEDRRRGYRRGRGHRAGVERCGARRAPRRVDRGAARGYRGGGS